MPTTDTPLRYPGGKSQLTPLVVEILTDNDLLYGEYAEPFAGGAGIAMHLLLNGYVSRIYLNDFDPSIYAFWYSVVHLTDDLCEKIYQSNVTIDEWKAQRTKLFDSKRLSILDRGFATFFLNRTNRSGIINAGVIGGLDQRGIYKLDCRFSKNDLLRKIQRIGSYRDQIELSESDAIDFLNLTIPKTSRHTLVNLDPPYFHKGQELYVNFYQRDDHSKLARAIKKLRRRWMLTYDDTKEIRHLYRDLPAYQASLNYSAQIKRVGSELLVLDPKIVAPTSLKNSRIQREVDYANAA